jgi:glycosyltransferase involved in cell wall biosynthesis
MRAVFIIHELSLNGAVIALLQLVRRMRAGGDSVAILTPRLTGAATALEGAFREAGAEIVTSVVRNQYDVAVGCTIFAAGMLGRLVGRMPTVWWIHEGQIGVNILIGRPSAMQTLMGVGKLIFPSRGVVERIWSPLLGRLPPGRVEVIPCAVPPPPPGPAMARQPGRARVICVGSICPRKRQVDLVQAIARLQGAPLECILVGENLGLDPPGDELVAAHPDRFVLTGGIQREALHGWLRSSDVFCLPSADESMPIAPIEAAWHGLPVVLADLECYQGVWRHGLNALIHPVGDVELLAWYLRMLLESPTLRARFAGACRTVPLRFTEQRVGPLFDAVLREAIATFR